jgi:Sulfotransferase family
VAPPNVDRMLEDVAAEIGLDDYGDPTFRAGLDHVVDSANRQAGLTEFGEAVLDAQCRGFLANRLRVTDWHRHHPTLANEVIEAPIFIVGLSRTGTTALSHLLAADPANRSLLGWEANDSVPPPTADGYATDPRFEAARNAPDVIAQLNPDFKAMHHDEPGDPMECSILLGQHFTSIHFSTMFNIPDYDEWVLGADWQPAYGFHRRVLQLLQSECPGRWQLKTPVHGLGILGLAATYPDARFVVTHRDPVKAAASVFSLVRCLSGTFSDVDHDAYIAEHWTELVAAMLERVIDFREQHGDDAFYDMDYRHLVSDPVGAVGSMYEHFGIELTPDADAAMRAYSTNHKQHAYGQHSYSLAEFGLERGALEERFVRYFDRFDVAREPV